jgi:hypothetical protein
MNNDLIFIHINIYKKPTNQIIGGLVLFRYLKYRM